MNKVEELIIDSLIELLDLTCITDSKAGIESRLVFPIKRDGKRRVSEQEARFLFVQHIERGRKFLYSIEAPTTKKYKFSGINDRSGNIDICLYENGERKHLIEFKALNPQQSSYSKDFEKLVCDEDYLTNYFIQVLENTDNKTIPSIENKYKKAIQIMKEKYASTQSCLRIFLCDMGTRQIIKYEVDKNGELRKEIIK